MFTYKLLVPAKILLSIFAVNGFCFYLPDDYCPTMGPNMTNIILGEAGDGAGVYFFMGVTGVTTGSRGGTPDFK